jgi:hypothetical protein
MQFEMVRLALVQRPQSDAFERRQADGQPFTREAWLRDVFEKKIVFQHRHQVFHYSPDAESADPGIIVGRIGREIKVSENEPPEQNLAPKDRPAWIGALVLIDPTHHDDGQKAAIQHIPLVGKPVPTFESLAASINGRDEPYVFPLINQLTRSHRRFAG